MRWINWDVQLEMLQQANHTTEDLPLGAELLRGQYMIEDFLIRGGFGMTYVARDSLDRRVVIKECFPGEMACRVGNDVRPLRPEHAKQFKAVLRYFLKEARRLSKLRHPGIVGVHQVFEENGTAYMALDFVEGTDLLSVLETDPDRLTPQLVKDALSEALDAIGYIHGLDILHRDIAPDNFMLQPSGKLVLIDFGAAQEHDPKTDRAFSSLVAAKDGYSPHEFYVLGADHNQSSDLYSLGATFYHLIAGVAPPGSQDRLAALAARKPDPYRPLADMRLPYPAAFLALIDRSLALRPQDRIQSVAQWQALLKSETSPAPVTASPEIDTGLDIAISQLVETTNRALAPRLQLAAAQPAAAPKPELEPEREPVAETPREPVQFVDILGNPIDDVDAWLKEQDGLNNDIKRARAGRLQSRDKNHAPDSKPQRRSILARFFLRRSNSAADVDPAIQN